MPRIKQHKFETYAAHTLNWIILDAPRTIAIDTETTGLKWVDRPFGVSVAWADSAGEIKSGYFELDDPGAALHCGRMFDYIEENGLHQIYFNAKFDIRMLINIGMLKGEPWYWEDILIPAAYTRPNGRRDLKSTAHDVLGMSTNEQAVLKDVCKELKIVLKRDGYFNVPREYIIPYAETDAVMTLKLYHHYLKNGFLKRWATLYAKEKLLTIILMEMEFAGLQLLSDQLKKEIRESDSIIRSCRFAIEGLIGGKIGKDVKKGEFNPGSHVQLKAYALKHGVTLTDTTSKTLMQYADKLPVLKTICVLKKEEKLRNTYLMPCLAEMDRYGILHPSWNQFGTNTGRLSSSGAAD